MKELPDRRAELFGRASELRQLLDFTQTKGLTAIVGRPQMGKSWLLTEVARQAAEDQSCLVGFAESYEGERDLLLRGINDLYERWLANASWREQALKVWNDQKTSWPHSFATAFGKIAGALPGIGKPLGEIVKIAIEGVLRADEALRGTSLPLLQYEQARDLVRGAAAISGQRIVLVFDQWEKSQDPAEFARIFDAFLRNREDWPTCHLLLGLRDEDPAAQEIRKLEQGYPAAARVSEISDLQLAAAELAELRAALATRDPAFADLSDDALTEMVGGMAGVIGRWRERGPNGSLPTESEIRGVADSAHAYSYPELEELLDKSEDAPRRLAIRLALLPNTEATDDWDALRSIVTQGCATTMVGDLCRKGLLTAARPPSFGHAKRREVTATVLHGHWDDVIEDECRTLIPALAAPITAVEPRFLPHVIALLALTPIAESRLGDPARGYCAAAGSLLGERAEGAHIVASSQFSRKDGGPGAGLLAVGLYNTLNHAKEETRLDRRDALLEELRALASAWPDDAAVREQLAMGLFNTLNDAKEETRLDRRDALLEELRALAGAWPDDAAVREKLAMGLFNTRNHAKEETRLDRRDALLEELRALASAWPDDAAVRERLAKGLYNTLNHAKEETRLDRRDALLEELRALTGAWPDDAAVRENLAMGLYNTLTMPRRRPGSTAATRCWRNSAPSPAPGRTMPPCARRWSERYPAASVETSPSLSRNGAGGAAGRQADHRHRADRFRPFAVQPPPPRRRSARPPLHQRCRRRPTVDVAEPVFSDRGTYDATTSRCARGPDALPDRPDFAGARVRAKLIRNVVPVAFASRASVRVEGSAFPPSHHATTSCLVPIRSASCCCVRPASARARISAAGRANSASSASYSAR